MLFTEPINQKFFGARQSGATAASAVGLLIDSDAKTKKSDTGATSWGAALNYNQTPPVVLGTTQTFKHRVVRRFAAAPRMRVRAEWEIVATATGGSPTGRLNVTAQRNGVAIGGGAKQNGVTRSLAAVNGTRFVEQFWFDLATTTWAAGDTLDFLFELELVASAGVASTGEARLNHDPAAPGRELVAEGF